jgi:hypothetical protein
MEDVAMSETRSSRCACGDVEVQITGEPVAMAYCHCESCRSWLGAPIHAASLWPTDSVTVKKGEAQLAVYKRTEESHRHFCTSCGAPVLIRHPNMGLTDVPAGSVSGLDYRPTIHVHYAEKVMAVRDGLPKYAGMPAADGAGEQLAE